MRSRRNFYLPSRIARYWQGDRHLRSELVARHPNAHAWDRAQDTEVVHLGCIRFKDVARFFTGFWKRFEPPARRTASASKPGVVVGRDERHSPRNGTATKFSSRRARLSLGVRIDYCAPAFASGGSQGFVTRLHRCPHFAPDPVAYAERPPPGSARGLLSSARGARSSPTTSSAKPPIRSGVPPC